MGIFQLGHAWLRCWLFFGAICEAVCVWIVPFSFWLLSTWIACMNVDYLNTWHEHFKRQQQHCDCGWLTIMLIASQANKPNGPSLCLNKRCAELLRFLILHPLLPSIKFYKALCRKIAWVYSEVYCIFRYTCWAKIVCVRRFVSLAVFPPKKVEGVLPPGGSIIKS